MENSDLTQTIMLNTDKTILGIVNKHNHNGSRSIIVSNL